MGKQIRSGYGYGMNENEAMEDFRDRLNCDFGEELYQGGGNDIREWTEVECLQKPVPASAPKKTKVVNVAPKDGKFVNGFIITTETISLMCLLASASFTKVQTPPVVEDYALSLTEAKKKSRDIAMKHNTEVQVLPARLWLDNQTNRLSASSRIYEVTPEGGTKAVPGKWKFKVLVAV